ncbi:MAG: DUF362 domain-containing protein [Thermodesulfobacteriota bacterium]|nr:DUF362 domain-containing protein [Thermodesulfobacteriota bacterium]
MNWNHPITRRQSLKRLARFSAGLTGAAIGGFSFQPQKGAKAETGNGSLLVEGVATKKDYTTKELVAKVFEAAGGMGQFVSRGEVVVIKPNVSWARAPELAATTNPEVIEAVIELCLDAGARKVRIADHTIHDARRCFALTGVGQVAKKTGADLVFPRPSLMKQMKLHGQRLAVWPVFVPLVEADRVLNVPVAKDHGLSTLTLGMKNWIGAVGGRRSALHQDIHQTIVDLAQFFKPTLTLIDATRIMTKNGPSGGSPADVAVKNTLILSNDQVAADARACGLFGYAPEEIGFVRLGQKWGLGTYDPQKVTTQEVMVS